MQMTMGRMITLVCIKSQICAGSVLKKYNITAAEQRFFMHVQSHKGMTQENLSAALSVDKAATARAVKSLEQKGYVTRVKDENDRRQNRIYPTQAAEEIMPYVKKDLMRLNDIITEGIDAQTLEAAYAALEKMKQNLTEMMSKKDEEQQERKDERS